MSSLIKTAAHLAARAHADQQRKYERGAYIIHPLRVAGRVTLLDDSTEEMIAAAWLHDVIEDTPYPMGEIMDACGDRVTELVMWLTSDSHKTLPREIRKERQRIRLAQAPREAKLIKCCDRLDNLQDLPRNDFRKLYAEESVLLCGALIASDEDLRLHPAMMALLVTAQVMAKG